MQQSSVNGVGFFAQCLGVSYYKFAFYQLSEVLSYTVQYDIYQYHISFDMAISIMYDTHQKIVHNTLDNTCHVCATVLPHTMIDETFLVLCIIVRVPFFQ